MKKTYTFEVKAKPQWPKTRCPKCNCGIVQIWHLIKPEESYDPVPYNGEWQYKCNYCGFEAPSAHTKRNAKLAWKNLCEAIAQEKADMMAEE